MGDFLDFKYQDYRYKLFVPSGYRDETPAPLLVMLHGCDQDPDDFAAGTNMNLLAERENFLVLYPDMNHLFNPVNPDGYNPYGCWNWFLDKNQHRGKGHPKLINGIIEVVKDSYNVDPKKIYAAGLSAGASLACILGVTYPDVFSGIGICAGLAYDAANVIFLTDPLGEEAKTAMQKGVDDPYVCGNRAFEEMGELKKKMPVIVFHGICDTVVHPINGQQVINQWAQTNFLVDGGQGTVEIAPDSVKSDVINGRSYNQHIYNDISGEPLMELWMIDEMGHTWPCGNPEGSYTDPLGPNATEIIWDFFKKCGRVEARLEMPREVLVGASVGTTGNVLIPAMREALVDTQIPKTYKELVEAQISQSHKELIEETSDELTETEASHDTTGEVIADAVTAADKEIHTFIPLDDDESTSNENFIEKSSQSSDGTRENGPNETVSNAPRKNFLRRLVLKFLKKKN